LEGGRSCVRPVAQEAVNASETGPDHLAGFLIQPSFIAPQAETPEGTFDKEWRYEWTKGAFSKILQVSEIP